MKLFKQLGDFFNNPTDMRLRASLCTRCKSQPIIDDIQTADKMVYVARCQNCNPFMGNRLCDSKTEALADWEKRNV